MYRGRRKEVRTQNSSTAAKKREIVEQGGNSILLFELYFLLPSFNTVSMADF